MSRTILIVAAHPDDEVLGCGGTSARHAAEGDQVHVLILGDGVSARGSHDGMQDRNASALKAARVLGTAPPTMLGLGDNRFDSLVLLDIVQKIEATVDKVQPQIVYTHHGHDLNIDHRVTHQAVVTACRPLPHTPVTEIYAFETVSSTEWQSVGPAFQPQHFVDISSTLGRKLDALNAYRNEMRPFPHARSMEGVEAMARLRGSAVGVLAAEAFAVVRRVLR